MEEMHFMKRNIKKALVCCFFIVCFTSCSQSKQNIPSENAFYNEPVYEWGEFTGKTLTIWTQEGELERIYMRRAIERYEELTGNDMIIIEIPKNEFESRVADGLSSNDNTPDLLLSYGGTNIETYQPDKNFYDFSDAVWVDDLTNTSINQTIYNGKVIGLPHWEASISGILFNKNIFDKFGLSRPKTQKEFLAVCEKLLENGVTPIYLPYKEISMLLYQFPLDTIVQETSILKDLNSGMLGYPDLEGMKEIVQWYCDMTDRGYFGEDYEQNDWSGMNDAMKSGDYAMMLCWDTWLYTEFDGEPSQYGLMPAFMGVPEEGTFEGPNLALLIVNKYGENVEAAVDFITFMADPYNYNVAFEGIYTAPVFKHQMASISTPQYVEAERIIDRSFRDSTAWLRIRGFSQMDAVCIQRCMTKETGYSIEQCLEDMERLRQERIHTDRK